MDKETFARLVNSGLKGRELDAAIADAYADHCEANGDPAGNAPGFRAWARFYRGQGPKPV